MSTDDRGRQHIHRGIGPGTLFEREPVGDEDEHRGPYATFEKAEDESCGIELAVGLDKGDRHGGKSPKEHEDRDSLLRTPTFCEDRGWDLQEHVAEEEDAAHDALIGLGEMNLARGI